MDSYLQYNKGSKGIKKNLKCSKPCWNDELTCNWKIMRDKEEKWRMFLGPYSRRLQLKKEFENCRSKFDKQRDIITGTTVAN